MDALMAGITVMFALIALAWPLIILIVCITILSILKNAIVRRNYAQKWNGKKIERSRSTKLIGGVCGGLGQFFDIDPTIIRCIWALAIIFAGAGLIPYLICWFVIPKETK